MRKQRNILRDILSLIGVTIWILTILSLSVGVMLAVLLLATVGCV